MHYIIMNKENYITKYVSMADLSVYILTYTDASCSASVSLSEPISLNDRILPP